MLSPQGLERVKKEIRHEVPKKFLVYIFVDDMMKLNFHLKNEAGKFCPEAQNAGKIAIPKFRTISPKINRVPPSLVD